MSKHQNNNSNTAFTNLNQKVDDATESIKKINADLETKYGKYLKDDYVPEGYDAKGLKDKVNEAIDQKEMEDIEREVDDKLAEIMSDVIDEANKE